MSRILLVFFLLSTSVCFGITDHNDALHRSDEMPYANARMFGLKTTATGAVNKAAILAAIASNTRVFIPDGTYPIDNTATPLTISRAGVVLFGSSNAILKAQNESVDLVRVMADDVSIEGISFQGVGGTTTDSSYAALENRPALLAIGATGSTVIQRTTVERCKFIDPAVVSLEAFKSVGAKILKNDFISTATVDPNTYPFLTHVYLQTSAYTDISHNSVVGMCQGIGGGGNSTDPFDSGDGVTSGYARHFTISGNTLREQADHSIYFSDDAQDYDIIGNVASSTNEVVKVQGIGITISGNSLDSALKGVIVGNAVSGLTIIGNNGKSYAANNPDAHGIYLGTVPGSLLTEGYYNITIEGNTITDVNGGNGAAINIDGHPSSSPTASGTDLNLIRNLTISGNTLTGWGDIVDNAGYNGSILIRQRPYADGTGSPAANITITGNTISMSDTLTKARSGIIIRGGCNGWTISGNTIHGIGGSQAAGATLQGCSNGSAVGNTILIADNATGTNYGGFRETLPADYGDASDPLYIATGTNNLYASNKIPPGSSFFVLARDASTEILHRLNNYATPNASVSFFPYYRYTNVFWEPLVNINMIPSTTSSLYTFEQNCEVFVHNLAATCTITFDPGGIGYVIPASSSASFVQVGTGTNANTWKGGK